MDNGWPNARPANGNGPQQCSLTNTRDVRETCCICIVQAPFLSRSGLPSPSIRPRRAMPAFSPAHRLSDREIDLIVAYLGYMARRTAER